MNSISLLVLVYITIDFVCIITPNYAIQKQSKSVFSNKSYTAAARYNTGNRIKYDNSVADNFTPEHYFPDVEYPINILEASKPFYVITGDNNAVLTPPFTDDVITNFNAPLIKQPIRKTSKDILRHNKSKTLTLKDVVYQTVDPEVIQTINKENLTIELENNIKKISSKMRTVPTTEQEAISQQTASTDKKNSEKSENMTSVDSQEYYDYDESYYEMDFSGQNNTDFMDEVEVFFVDEFLNGGTRNVDNNTIEDASVENGASHNNYDTLNATLESGEETLNPNNFIDPETCPLNTCTLPAEKNSTKINIEPKPSKKIGYGPIQKVKQRKFLKHMNKSPLRL